MAFEYYIRQGSKQLRCGYTTGSCAALAAGAACRMLLTGKTQNTASIVTPGGIEVAVDLLNPVVTAASASCAVRKDAGDDIDATDGIRIYARVEKRTTPGIQIDGGRGIGRVTKPGLEQPVGAAAINRIPRQMIGDAVKSACEAAGYHGGISVVIEAPEGALIAEKTFNPHLGIEGGISILGTSGIVEPKSLQALVDTIELEIRQHAALGIDRILLTPGNYGENFIASRPEFEGWTTVVCSNFIGQAVDLAAHYHIKTALVVGHIGKLVKVAGGIMDTHSRMADCRVELIAAHAAYLGADQMTVQGLMESVTTDACLALLDGVSLTKPVIERLLAAIERHLVRRADGALSIGAVMFDQRRGLLGMGKCAREILEGGTQV